MISRDNQPVPSAVIVIGAGIFGLSTAIAIAKRHPETKVTVVDRLTPPVLDGTSVDTTRCIRADYIDPIYAHLAKQSMQVFLKDPGLRPYVHQQGMTFVCDGQPSRFTDSWKARLDHTKKTHSADHIVELSSPEEVFQRIHGKDSQPPSASQLGGPSRWNKAYCNLEDAFVDAKECVRVYYERCLGFPSIVFRCGHAVKRIDMIDGNAESVTLDNGDVLKAKLVIVAAGAWSTKLVDLGSRIYPIGHEVAWIKVTPEEERRWKNMSITTNESTGLNMFPPYQGEIKILRRSPGYKNTITVTSPEDESKAMQISYPRTLVTNPSDEIPLDAEIGMRENLREIMPMLAGRPFDRTRICWINTTPTGDFLIAPHPRIPGIHLATGGSAHAWKFLPIIGDLVLDSIEGTLSEELQDKWKFEKTSDSKDQNAPRMDGQPEELCDKVRIRL